MPCPPPEYTVKAGDTLSGIAQRFYGSPHRWPDIWTLNAQRLRSSNPNLIYPGEVIKLPPR